MRRLIFIPMACTHHWVTPKMIGFLMIRPATPKDLDALVRLEAIFPGDRMSRQSFRRLLKRDSASILVYEENGEIIANSVVLYRRGSSSARVYSLVVHPHEQGRGIARALLKMVESAALNKGCSRLRLEVRADNHAALALYTKLGYIPFGQIDDYYQDHTPAQRLCKVIS